MGAYPKYFTGGRPQPLGRNIKEEKRWQKWKARYKALTPAPSEGKSKAQSSSGALQPSTCLLHLLCVLLRVRRIKGNAAQTTRHATARGNFNCTKIKAFGVSITKPILPSSSCVFGFLLIVQVNTSPDCARSGKVTFIQQIHVRDWTSEMLDA